MAISMPAIRHEAGASGPAVVIRPARREEAHAIALVHVRADRETYAPIFGAGFQEVALEESRLRWETALAAGDVFLVAEDEGRIVGFGHATNDWMSALYLVATHLRRGIGSRLLAALRAELRARGAAEVGFKAVAGNERALAFYAAQGAREIDRRRQGEGDAGWEDVHFVLPI
jgi:GNAT superfamily N-acetyltransferase